MAKLNQIIAIERGEKQRSERKRTDVHKLSSKEELFSGLTRTYKPIDEEDQDKLPPEKKLVERTVQDAIEDFTSADGRLLDVTATKDWANTKAKADVKIDGNVILEGVPVTFLLFLEKRIIDLRTFVSKLPTLDPAKEWSLDSNTGFYKTDVQETIRTKKVRKNHVLAEATPEHPAQVEMYTEDVPVGKFEKIDFSGAWPRKRVDDTIARCDALLNAVKFAREQANETEVEDITVSEAIYGYVFDDI